MSRTALWPRLLGILVGLALGSYYIGFQILGWSVSGDTYRVTVNVPRAAGLFEGSEVTLRGVKVGDISSIDIAGNGVRLGLDIDGGTKIPVSTTASVRMLSALGENYVDLVPSSDSGPLLADGSVIPIADTSVPTPVSEALGSASTLLNSIDPRTLDSLQNLLADAFGDVAPQLKTLVHTGNDLTDALIAAAPATTSIVDDGRTVLRTANATSGDLNRIIESFKTLSAQFVASDADLAQLIRQGGSAATAIEQLVRQETGPFVDLLNGSAEIGTAVQANQTAIRVLFAMLPTVSTNLAGAARNGTLSGQMSLNLNQPVCSFGPLPLPGAGSAGPGGYCPPGPNLLQRGPARGPGD